MSKSAVERPVDRPEQTIAGTLRRNGRHIMANWIRELALLPVIVLLLVIGAFVNPAFLTAANFINVAQESAALGAVVVAETLILLLVGLAVGAFNGFMVIKLGFNAFIFTLAVLILLTGIQVGIVSGRTIYHLPDAYIYLGSQYLLGVPVSVWVTGAIFLFASLFLRYHRVGRAIYAIGGNTEAARAAGIRVDRVRIGVFIVASLLAALAGLMTAGQVVAVTAGQGNNLIFSVFAAAVIGGISLEGGRGRMVGALTGVILLALVQNILILSQIQTFWIDAATGLIILIALALARLIGTERA